MSVMSAASPLQSAFQGRNTGIKRASGRQKTGVASAPQVSTRTNPAAIQPLQVTKDIHLTSRLAKRRGVIGRYPSEDERYFLEYDTVAVRPIHMLFVRKPLKVTWVADGEITYQTELQPWTGYDKARADTVIEERP